MIRTGIILMALIGACRAPFPPGHPYNSLNPWIDTWWHDLNDEQQKVLYGAWEEIEPFMVAVANKLTAHSEKQNAFKSLLQKFKNDPLGYPKSDEKAYDQAQIVYWKTAKKEALEAALEEKKQIPARFQAYYKKLQDSGDIKVVQDLYDYGQKKLFGHGQ